MLIMKYCRRSKPKHLYSGSQIILNAFLLRTYMYIYTVFLFKKKNYKISIKVKGYSTNLAKPLRTRASMKLIVRSINDTSSTKTFPLCSRREPRYFALQIANNVLRITHKFLRDRAHKQLHYSRMANMYPAQVCKGRAFSVKGHVSLILLVSRPPRFEPRYFV